ncbi:hypothetical protein Mal15_22210 [Stieleria maiorica]|uniref:Helicase ATP-binding domain-containing protein n=1 Tax=Stieleria maiorica TaxID=2795974 RepID=A0A5B9MBP4_9BACT|nr:DEAD/DEAH box helicase [Stieleria maiorica]QEF98173.1 hypothetical protein Mal15_22210 [Stieleria maiorica]
MKFFSPHEYQHHALAWLIRRTIVEGQSGGALFLDPGLGKTATTLCWLRLLKSLGLSRKTLVVAPLRVVYSVWGQECKKWSQFAGMTCSIVHGSSTHRMKALSVDADLYLINPEGIPWLQTYYAKRPLPFGTLVVDESSKFKNWSALRTKALRKMLGGFRYRLILTGTPSPNGIADLFSQVFILDQGEALGTGVTKFRNRYFYRGGFGGYKWILNEGSQKRIEQKIDHLCLRLSAEDHLDLPEMLINDVWIDLPTKALKEYRRLEREMFLELDAGDDLVLSNAGAKYNACRQMAGGGIYDEDKKATPLHSAKMDAVVDLVDELQGKPALVAYSYTHELERLRKVFPSCKAIYGATKGKEADALIEQWNKGELHLLAVQPKSLSHGINMQAGPGRDIIWFGLTDNLEDYQQLNARIHRQGVDGNVRIHRILARETIDEAIAERIESKDQAQSALLDALNKYRGRYGA